jgi:hypothetical protein
MADQLAFWCVLNISVDEDDLDAVEVRLAEQHAGMRWVTREPVEVIADDEVDLVALHCRAEPGQLGAFPEINSGMGLAEEQGRRRIDAQFD